MGLKSRLPDDVEPGSGRDAQPDRAAPGNDRGIAHYKRKLLEEVDLSELVKLGPSQRRARLESLRGRPAQPRRARCCRAPRAAR